jgi:hypothetical protein
MKFVIDAWAVEIAAFISESSARTFTTGSSDFLQPTATTGIATARARSCFMT